MRDRVREGEKERRREGEREKGRKEGKQKSCLVSKRCAAEKDVNVGSTKTDSHVLSKMFSAVNYIFYAVSVRSFFGDKS